MRGRVGVSDELLRHRSAGVLLHVTSLPNGVLDDHAERFVDWLADAGQRWWQVLPLGPPDPFGSPYSSRSAFAMWPGLLADHGEPVSSDDVERFRRDNILWADAWAAFAGPDALADQVRVSRRWARLRAHAASRGVRILGDLPLYVAQDGLERTTQPELFQEGAVAGVPPDYFSEDGQLWGNPLYDWDAMRSDGFAWWVARMRRAFELHDAVRLDHFRGLEAYWAVPHGAETAREGEWRPAPGRELLERIREDLGTLPILAEDLGIITDQVDELRRGAGLPGMIVLQFELGETPVQDRRLWHEHDRVVYPGTHDNATVTQWWDGMHDHGRWTLEESLRRAGGEPGPPHRMMVELAHRAPAVIAIVSVQDLLGLGAEARMNTPALAEGNWSWRMGPDALTADHARWLRELTASTGRIDPGPGGAG